MPGSFLYWVGLTSSAHQNPQYIPEQQHYRGEQLQRRANILLGAVIVLDLAGLVQDTCRGQYDHRHRKPQSEIETENRTGHDRAQGDKTANDDCRTQE